MEKPRIGIIGVGQIGKSHLQEYRDLPVEVIAAADIDASELNSVAAGHGIRHVFTDFRELLAIDDIDAVDVCLHNNLHAPVTIAALEAGKHVYCEKPIAGSYADAKAMVEAAERTKRMLSVQLHTLFAVETKAAARLIEDGYLGKPYYAKSSRLLRRYRPYVDGYGASAFVQREVASGGALLDHGVYNIAQVLHLLGNPRAETIAGATHQEIPMYPERPKESGYNVEEFAAALVRLEGGITLSVEQSWAIHLGGAAAGSAVFGARGGIQLRPFAYFSTVADLEMDATFDLKMADRRWHLCHPQADAYDSPQSHWVAALQNRVPLIDTAGLALSTMLISEGLYLSTRLGREVTAAEVDSQSTSSALDV